MKNIIKRINWENVYKTSLFIAITITLVLNLIVIRHYKEENIELKGRIERYKDSEYNYEERLKLYAQDTEDMRKFCDSIWWESYYHHVQSYQEGHTPEEYEYYE